MRSGPVDVPGAAWAWAFSLVSPDSTVGHLVVGADDEPAEDEHFMLGVLVQQAAAALANARLHARLRDTAELLQTTNVALERTAARAERSAAATQRSLAIHHRLTRVAVAGEGDRGLAAAVHELTGRAVTIEDHDGHVLATPGPAGPHPTAEDLPIGGAGGSAGSGTPVAPWPTGGACASSPGPGRSTRG
jgi:hypothetical protein